MAKRFTYGFVLSVILTLASGCQDATKKEACCKAPLTEEERKMYLELGEIGVGDAYSVIVDENHLNGGSPDHARALPALALKNGSFQSNLEYARRLYEVAILRPAQSPAREVLLDEAKKRLEYGAREYLKLDFVTGPINQDKKYYRLKSDHLDLYDNLYNDIEAAQKETPPK